jgi:predicted PurR-regulated permease PerM
MAYLQWPAVLAALSPLFTLAAIALLVMILAQAQAVLVPLALAVTLAFVLTPLVKVLEQWIPRVVAVTTVVIVVLALVVGLG